MTQNKLLPLLAASIVFTSPVQSIGVGVPSAALTLSAQESISQTGCIALTTSSGTGKFSSSATNWSSVTVLTMNKSTSNRSFFYRDSASGTHTLKATFALKPSSVTDSCASWPQSQWGNTSQTTQSITVGTNTQTPQATSTTNTPPTNVAPQTLTIKITSQPTVVVGAGSSFTGSATNSHGGVGSDTRYIWNFGDGSTKEGPTAFHTYTYPGTYNVMLSASSGDKAGIGHTKIQVVPAQIGMLVQPDGSVLISNESSYELNIGSWNISSGMSSFLIPPGTTLSSGQSVRFSTDVMHMVAGADTVLKYPNNFPAPTVSVPTQKTSSPESEGGGAVGGAPQRDGARTEQISSKKSEYPETASAADAITNASGPVLWPYVLGALGLILIGVGLFFKKNPMKKVTNRALDEFDMEG